MYSMQLCMLLTQNNFAHYYATLQTLNTKQPYRPSYVICVCTMHTLEINNFATHLMHNLSLHFSMCACEHIKYKSWIYHTLPGYYWPVYVCTYSTCSTVGKLR
jgi:hypothetical protein